MMLDRNAQQRIVMHGAVILLLGLLCGLPSVVEEAARASRVWQGAHAALLTLGVWLLATGAVLPLLLLEKREARALLVSLPLMAYSFAAAVIIQAVTGIRSISPDVPPINKVAFAANLIAVLSSFLSAALTLLGAVNAIRVSKRARATTLDSAPTLSARSSV